MLPATPDRESTMATGTRTEHRRDLIDLEAEASAASGERIAFASLHDELLHETALALREALAHVDEARLSPDDEVTSRARSDAGDRILAAADLLHRADLAAVGVLDAYRDAHER